MKNKLLLTSFVTIFFINIFAFNLEKIDTIYFDSASNELLANTSNFKVIYDSEKYYIKTRYDQKIIEFNQNGKKIREFGGKGRGPGEFGGLLGFGINKNKIIAIDYILYRITIIDLQTNKIETIPLKVDNKYSFNLNFFGNNLFLCGHYAKNILDPLNELFLISKYDFSKKNNNFISNYIRIDLDYTENFGKSNKYTKNKSIKSFITIKQPKAIKNGKKLIIADPFLSYFIIFDSQNNKFIRKEINFPDYVKPNKFNVLTEYKKMRKHKDSNDGIEYGDFVYCPVRFSNLRSINKYSIIYKLPYQKRKNSEKKYIEVVFDRDFNFLSSHKVERIIDYYWNGENDMALKLLNFENDKAVFELYKVKHTN